MSKPTPGDVALAKTLIYETTRANRERTPRGVFSRHRMTATETLEAAVEPHTGPIAYGPQTTARLAYNRLRRLGWQFEIAPRVDAVLVMKPNGGKWHTVTGEACDCEHYGRKRQCTHAEAVRMCGGVKQLREFISEDTNGAL